ncbi:uncharacterized protein PHACADRAFT_262040 [Phanerochaete carnosa HHB-10118-sp]|uniref:Uncharacterized protein n=1 Tax=Phanerochaete carnosa (strain HHB-10118-sp) TaxID=650164 RepID=K5WN16_PHACS|nr:uncharacterized protein PHACADRAFT_262040 [Phanerochaete carnosa HHB-10118-sp]EKM51722.1 hypothetical protein PHACADRAFT_262040 [Phanerochaete carnosa HHB-10118-sp]
MFRHLPAPYKIFSSSLSSLQEGHALWYPEPHESGEPQIGDVGFLLRGAFIRLFNLDTSLPERKVSFWHTTFEDIEPLPPRAFQIDRRHRPLVPDSYRSHGVENTRVHSSEDINAGNNISATLNTEYTCRAAHGAVLQLSSEAHPETIFESRELKKYIVRNHDKWFAYTMGELGQAIEPADLVMVSGWVKTEADWATATFSNMSTSTIASLEGRVGDIGGFDTDTSHTSFVAGPTMQRHGENYLARMSGTRAARLTRDQCVFLKRYRLKTRLEVLRRAAARAAYHRYSEMVDEGDFSGDEDDVVLEVGDPDEDDSDMEGESDVADLLDILLDYILETTDVEIAIASDDEIASIMGDNQVDDFAGYLRQMQVPVEVADKVGSICIEDVISHEQDRALASRTIPGSDFEEWPNVTLDGAGRLDNPQQIFIGPTEAEARPLQLKQLIFHPSNADFCRCWALSTDGKLLAASFYIDEIFVWRLSDGLLVQRLCRQGHTNCVDSLAFSPSPDNSALVSGSEDKTAVVWDTKRGRELLRLEGHASRVDYVVYAPHAALVATASSGDRSVKVWDASTGARLHSFSIDEDISKLAFSPDGSRFYVGLLPSCSIYDTQTFAHITTLQHEDRSRFEWSMPRRGDRMVIASADGQVKIRSAMTGEELLAINHPKPLSFPAAFSPDGAEILATCNANNEAITYDSQTGELRRVYNLPSRVCHVAYSSKGDYVALCSVDEKLQVYDARSGAFLARFEGKRYFGRLQFLPDRPTLLIHPHEGPLRLLNIRDVLRMR